MATQVLRSGGLTAERRFFGGSAIAMVAAIVIGFLPFYYLRGVIAPPVPLVPMTPLVHLHGAVFTGWMLLYLTQTMLVSAGRRDIHMKLGLLAFALLPVMIVIGTLAGLYQVARASGPPITSPLNWLSIPLLSVPLYTGLIVTALTKRRDPASHKRYMFLAMVEMTSPGFGRIPWPDFVPGPVGLFGFTDLFLIALVAFDLKQTGKIHRATAIGGIALVGSQVLRLAVWDTAPWLAFARWAVALVS